MKPRSVARFFFAAGLALALAAPAWSQVFDSLVLQLTPGVLIPLAGSSSLYKVGGEGVFEARLMLPQTAPFFPLVEVGYGMVPSPADKTLSLLTTGLGVGAQLLLGSRFGAGVSAGGGYYAATWGDAQAGHFYVRGKADFTYRFTPAFSLSLGASYSHFFGPTDALYQGIGASLTGSLSVGGLRGGTNVIASDVRLDPVFPIFYAFYDRNTMGSVTVTNREDGDVQDVKVSFFVKQYMDQPKTCATFPSLARGKAVQVPLYAIFTDQVLRLTESTKVSADVIVEYSFLGSRREARFTETLRVNHRNAMTWDDDRRAAAFVSAKDPAVLRYSKFAAGVIREAGTTEIDQNLRFAMGLFEGLRIYGLNYVVDPTTPHKEMSENKSALDYLQFPYQTLVYRGGDCDDLSIMFASVLESVGIRTAFITIPGHIYMAFGLSMDEATAKGTFVNPEEVIYREGGAWIPVEITLINEGFVKAWSVGAKEYQDNAKTGTAAFIPVASAWEVYEPVGIPGEDTRIVLPEAEALQKAYRTSLARFTERELSPRVERLRSEISRSGGSNPALTNKLGVLYARYGLLAEARAEFERGSRAGHTPALTNLGNVAYLQKDYAKALDCYERALKALPDNKVALLGLARTQYELDNFPGAERAYAMVTDLDPKLASEYSYLTSKSEGAARASASATQRTGGTAWSEE
jgi:hypothetical protein